MSQHTAPMSGPSWWSGAVRPHALAGPSPSLLGTGKGAQVGGSRRGTGVPQRCSDRTGPRSLGLLLQSAGQDPAGSGSPLSF